MGSLTQGFCVSVISLQCCLHSCIANIFSMALSSVQASLLMFAVATNAGFIQTLDKECKPKKYYEGFFVDVAPTNLTACNPLKSSQSGLEYSLWWFRLVC